MFFGAGGIAATDEVSSPNKSISGFVLRGGACAGWLGADDVRKDADLSSFAFSCTMLRGCFRQLCSPVSSGIRYGPHHRLRWYQVWQDLACLRP